jgi:hypothetical protein
MKSFLFLAGIALACTVTGMGCASTSTSSTGPKKITLKKPSNQTLKRGATSVVEVKIFKENLNSDVTVRFENLPRGIEVTESESNSKDNECIVNYTLSATLNAGLVSEQVIRVTAEGPDGLAVTESFELTVNP